MKCDFDIPYRVTDALALKDVNPTKYRWMTNENGDQVFEPFIGGNRQRFGRTGTVTGICWLLLAFSTTDLLALGAIFLGAFLFIIGGWLLGWLLDQMGSKEPLLTVQPDGTIVLHRLKQTVTPNNTTHFEFDKVEARPRTKGGQNFRYELILWHDEKSYYVATGKRSGRFSRSPLEQLQADLQEKSPKINREPISKDRFPDNGMPGFGCLIWFLLPFAVGFCGIGCWSSMYFVQEINLGNESRHWPYVEGHVTESILWEYQKRVGGRSGRRGGSSRVLQYQEHIVYEYSVNDSEYQNDRVVFKGNQKQRGDVGSQNRAYHQAIVDRYPVGKTVPVYFHENEPQLSVLEPGRSNRAVLSYCLSLVFLFIGSLFANVLILFGVPHKREQKSNQ